MSDSEATEEHMNKRHKTQHPGGNLNAADTLANNRATNMIGHDSRAAWDSRPNTNPTHQRSLARDEETNSGNGFGIESVAGEKHASSGNELGSESVAGEKHATDVTNSRTGHDFVSVKCKYCSKSLRVVDTGVCIDPLPSGNSALGITRDNIRRHHVKCKGPVPFLVANVDDFVDRKFLRSSLEKARFDDFVLGAALLVFLQKFFTTKFLSGQFESLLNESSGVYRVSGIIELIALSFDQDIKSQVSNLLRHRTKGETKMVVKLTEMPDATDAMVRITQHYWELLTKLQELVQELDWTKTDARSTLEVKLKKGMETVFGKSTGWKTAKAAITVAERLFAVYEYAPTRDG